MNTHTHRQNKKGTRHPFWLSYFDLKHLWKLTFCNKNGKRNRQNMRNERACYKISANFAWPESNWSEQIPIFRLICAKTYLPMTNNYPLMEMVLCLHFDIAFRFKQKVCWCLKWTSLFGSIKSYFGFESTHGVWLVYCYIYSMHCLDKMLLETLIVSGSK